MTKAVSGSQVAVLGASPKEDRYSFKAVRMLVEHGFAVVPVHPAGHVVDGLTSLKSLADIDTPIDTLTMYVSEQISAGEFDRIVTLKPRRVIFNPGSENNDLASKLTEVGIEIVEACTLVMLRTNQF